MARRRKRQLNGPRYDALKEAARERGYYVSTHSPGDGVTRYKFFDRPGNHYFGPDSGVCTALGLKKAYKFLHTGTCPRTRSR